MTKSFFLLSLLTAALLFASCHTIGCDPEPMPCIDESKVCITCFCTADYDPVCGCNDVTYTNECNAEVAGVTSYTKGTCKGGN